MPTRRSLKKSQTRIAQSGEDPIAREEKNRLAFLQGESAFFTYGMPGSHDAQDSHESHAEVDRGAKNGFDSMLQANGERSVRNDMVAQEDATVQDGRKARKESENRQSVNEQALSRTPMKTCAYSRKSAAKQRVATPKTAKSKSPNAQADELRKTQQRSRARSLGRTERENRRGSCSPRRTKKRHSFLHIALAVVGGVFAALVIVCAAIAVDRWFVHDDAQDIQGTWYIYGTEVAVPISENTIGIAEGTEYRYTIDTQAKTVTYSIGNLTGTSHYRFSSDRTQIALIEDGKKVFTATLFDDISWWFASLGTALSGETVLPGPLQSNVIMLTRTPLSTEGQKEESQEDADQSDTQTENQDVQEGTATQAQDGQNQTQTQDALQNREDLASQAIQDVQTSPANGQ